MTFAIEIDARLSSFDYSKKPVFVYQNGQTSTLRSLQSLALI